MLNRKKLSCDLCVIGGGIAGIGAAVSAAREGQKVVLMHERPVLGGNASSEIRMWICGAAGENNRETSINEYAHPLHASRMERASHQRRHGKPQAGSVQRLRELLVS